MFATPKSLNHKNNSSVDISANSDEISPAITSIALFKRSSYRNSKPAKKCFEKRCMVAPISDDMKRCAICMVPFGLEAARAVPKMLPCGHNFCAECIFSLCLHREYYLLENIFCLKCGRACEARIAMNAPINFALCKALEKKDEKESNNVTVIHLGDTIQKNDDKKKQSHTIINNDFLQKSTPRNRNKNRNSKRTQSRHNGCSGNESSCDRDIISETAEIQKGYLSSAPEDPMPNAADRIGRPLVNDKCNFDCGGDSCGTSGEYDGAIYEQISSKCFQQNASSEGPKCCRSRESLQMKRKNSAWRRKFLRLSQKFDCELLKIRQFDGDNDANCHADIHADLNDELLRKADCSKNFHEIIDVFAKTKKILVRDFFANCLSVNDSEKTFFVSRLETIFYCFLRNKNTIGLALHTHEDPSIFLGIYLEAILGLIFATKKLPTKLPLSTQQSHILALEKLARDLRALPAIPRKFDIFKSCVRSLMVILNENCPSEAIPFFDISLNTIFKTLKTLSKHNGHDFAEQTQLWKMAQSAFSELLRIASIHWHSADPNRIALVANMTYICVLFADVCDTTTVLVCMIEAARARASITTNANTGERSAIHDDNVSADKKSENPNAELSSEIRDVFLNGKQKFDDESSALFYLRKIDENLIECRRIQKLAELRSRTRVLKKFSTIAPMEDRANPPYLANVSEAKNSNVRPRKRFWHRIFTQTFFKQKTKG